MSVIAPTFRSRFRATIERPVAAVFVRTGLSPNALTLIGLAIAVVGAWLAASGQHWFAAGLVIGLGAIFDLFDGALARATGKTSRFGAFLDSTLDRVGEAVVYIGVALGCLATIGFESGAIVALGALAASFMVSYTRAKSESLGFSTGTGMASVGMAPREVRVAILVAGLILTDLAGGTYGVQLCCATNYAFLIGRPWLLGSVGLIAVLATITTIQRIYFVYRQSKSPN